MTGLRARKREALTKEFIRAAGKRFAKYGFEGTRMDDICDDVMMSPPTIHRYFRTKAMLFVAWAQTQKMSRESILEILLGREALDLLFPSGGPTQ